ncbi:hypothetical protein AU467_20485 [Mesorhizobium loti]|uniref:Uncharacterized protein n=1 Tax=Rhizobium loti TaxID=381 RepID=A0A117N3U3_RHILI|nr:hypothetical protein AU467_20485 [Mesorhizobium loti]
MPEQPEKWPRGAAWTLTHAHDAGQVAGIRCARCNVTRYYKPAELREVIGNVTIDEVRDKVRCQKCGSREWMSAQLFHPTGEQVHTIATVAWCRSDGRSASFGATSDGS